MAIKRCEKRGSGGRPVRERPCRRRSPFPFDKIIRSCRSSSYSVSVCRSSDQPPTSVVLVRESRRGLRVGGGGVNSSSSSSWRRRLSQIRRRRSFVSAAGKLPYCGFELFLVASEERKISDGKSEVACEALGGCGERGWMRSRHGD
ncbi:hypothetical protein DY000_02056853 [Brassica cretica]|uniref:Uncharacterized protein n=1 Tax=Brassica cretica TaxID=69181 RepID=A0ABQ7A462_BRACR|nr:hypothetical protein DY000_02056853 [Brassica cretica]